MNNPPFLPPLPLPSPSDLVIGNSDNNNLPSEADDSVIESALIQWSEHFYPIEVEKRADNILTHWRITPTLLQQGPQCGLIALTMAAQSFGINLQPEEVFQKAVNMGVTKQGEMFNATALADVSNQFNLSATVDDNGMNNIQSFLNSLCTGKLFLVPYDADGNHSPCLKNGHKAHWALVFGFILLASRIPDGSEPINNRNIYRIRNNKPLPEKDVIQSISKDCTHLLAKHGKSRRTAIWSYKSLEESNANLFYVDPKRNDPLNYVLPPESRLKDCLCHKVILLNVM